MDFVGTILSSLIEPVINYVKRHGDYVIRYKSKVQLLEQEKKRLGEKKETIRVMVDTATNSGKVIKTEVSSWLKDAEDMEGDIANILHPQEDRESFKCFKGCMCPNLMWRHKMGKEAHKRKLDVSELISRGEPLQTSPVARDAPFQWQPHFDSSQYYTTFDSRASVFNKIMDALKDSGADMIGVHGPGGAGKTTMVKEVAKEAKDLGIFDKIVIVVVSKDPNTSKLQEDLAPQLDLNYGQTGELGRADELRKALLNGKRKILVILDDLWQMLDLKAIGIPISGLGDRGCKILLTSRNKEVFNMMEVCLCFSIGHLEEQETWELFTKVTGEFGVDGSIARKVSKRCGGLPIAIVAVGAALRGQKEFVWNDALHQLEKCPLEHIEGIHPKDYTPLKWSYDFLKEKDAKSCFLICCLFPEDAEIFIDDLVNYSFALGFLREVDTLKVARNRVQAMVNMLKSSCLLLNGENENFVKMHDLIRDLAISITKEKQTENGGGHDWPGQQQFIVDHNIQRWPRNDDWKHHTAISLRIKDDNFPFRVLDCPQVHTLVLECEFSRLEIPNDFIKGMTGARILDLRGMFLKLPSLSEFNNLRMLRINGCHFEGDLKNQNLEILLKNQNLEILSIVSSFGIRTLPRGIGELIRLRSLDLRNCQILSISKGVISKLISLEELYVPMSFKRWDTTTDLEGMSNASITELNSLTHLRVLHVNMSAESSKIMVLGCADLFKKLTNFFIRISNFNDFWMRYSSGVRPVVYQCLESRNVLEIFSINGIDDKFHLLMDKVDMLKLGYIQDLRYLGDKSASFCNLTYLQIVGCHGMKYLFFPSCAKAFLQLKELRVEDCGRMEQIIGVDDHYIEEEVGIDVIIFSRLREMCLQSLPQFRCFCPKMMKATIEGNLLNSTDFIFDEKVFFPVLETLDIKELSMKYLFSLSCAKTFQQLKKLHVENCGRMEQIIGIGDSGEEVEIDEVIIFSGLREMQLRSLPQFRCFCPKMMKGTIEGNLLNSAEFIFDEKVLFPVLEKLSIDSLPVKYLFSSSRAKAFQQLQVKNCGRMEQIIEVGDYYNEEEVGIDEVIIFSRLKEMCLRFLPQFRCFCPKMMKVTIEGNLVNSGDFIFDEKVFFPVLETLDIKELSMKYLFSLSCAKSFQQLKKLHVENCGRMEQIIGVGDNEGEVKIDEVILFNGLREVQLRSLPQFRCFCPKMMKGTIEGNLLNSAEFIFDEKVSFPVLEKLKIIELPVKYLFSPSCAKVFQQLEELDVYDCARIEQIIGDNEGEVGIDEVIIFSRLTELNLLSLPQFRCFCPKMTATVEGNLLNSAEFIFDEKVSFPVLRSLYICELPVKYLFSQSCAKAFQQLEQLHVRSCGRMEQIIGVDDHYIEEEVGIDEVIIFSRLTMLTLVSLPQFRCFCPKIKKATIEGNLLNSAESIIDEKVSFPVLEDLDIIQLPVKNIWNKETIQSSNSS